MNYINMNPMGHNIRTAPHREVLLINYYYHILVLLKASYRQFSHLHDYF
ncbi:hypothetical protein BXY41_11657 [Lacrimispora xylanisolvens]|uniref:Uncharacterized protein n=1 Tax=Lacrimispora xylanisolvens TaxID=384636 RepID=A0A2S6HJ61_9FIRM|nr:hypothetical protein BXY41_11657 [Hungatella xylanolytica]